MIISVFNVLLYYFFPILLCHLELFMRVYEWYFNIHLIRFTYSLTFPHLLHFIQAYHMWLRFSCLISCLLQFFSPPLNIPPLFRQRIA